MTKTWDHHGIIEKFEACRNEELARPMAAYMKNQFPFLGIQSPLRKQLFKEQFTEYALPKPDAIFKEAWKLYRLQEREYQYAAIALLEKMSQHLTADDLPFLRNLIETKSWWDSVDAIAPTLVGKIVLTERETGAKIMFDWSASDNMWTNRAAILHQLKYKGKTDTELLANIVRQHAESPEFFHQKAIGWALREYAKTDLEWVKRFVSNCPMKPLSKREALKNIIQ